MPYVKSISVRATVHKTLKYILNPDKTDGLLYTSSMNCMTSARDAYLEMKSVFESYSTERFDAPPPKKGKGSVKAIHYIQSFDPKDNISPELAYRIAKAFVRKTFGEECQAVIATHTDRHHLHTHFILNTYSITGKRFYDNWHSRNHVREYSDRVCLAFGIQPIEHSGRSKSTSYAEWYNRGRGTSWKEQIRQELDRLVPEVKNLDELFAVMEEHGFTIRRGRCLMLKAPNQKRAIRLDNLGDLYSLDCLDIRILYHTGELQNCVRLTDLQKAYGLVLGETITLKREGRNHTDIQRLAAQLAVISCEGIRSIGEVEGKAEAYRAECRRIAGEIEKLDKSSADAEKRLSMLRNQYEKAKQHFDVYSDIVQTYRTISRGDYISKFVAEERKRQAVEKSRRNKNGKITSYRIRVFDHRDTQTYKQVFRTLSIKYDMSKSEAWNRRNAEKQGAIFEKQIEEHTISDSHITFDSYCEYAIGMKEQAGLSHSTIYSYTGCRKRVAPYIGHIQLKQLTPAAINKAYSDMLSTGVSKATVYQYHLFIHSMLAMAFKENLIPRNYASAAMPPKRDAKEVQALSEEEINAFFTALYADSKHYMYQVLFSLMLATGCRIGEICALTWDNIDFESNRIHICRHFVCGKSGSQIMDGCKTNAGDRWLTLDDGIMDMLREYRVYYLKKAESYGSKWNNEENAVFYAEKRYGGCINPDTVRAFLTRFTRKHGLKKIHPHMFRHTSVSLQLQAGISIADAAKRAGHARPDVTLRIYSHALKKNDLHCCEAVTKAMPKRPKREAG